MDFFKRCMRNKFSLSRRNPHTTTGTSIVNNDVDEFITNDGNGDNSFHELRRVDELGEGIPMIDTIQSVSPHHDSPPGWYESRENVYISEFVNTGYDHNSPIYEIADVGNQTGPGTDGNNIDEINSIRGENQNCDFRRSYVDAFAENTNTSSTSNPAQVGLSSMSGFGLSKATVIYNDRTVISERSRVTSRHPKFGTDVMNMVLQLNLEDNINKIAQIKKAMDEIVRVYVQENSNSADRVGLTISPSVGGDCDNPIGISFRRPEQYDADLILDVFQKVCQSNENFLLGPTLGVKITRIQLPHGYGNANFDKTISLESFAARKQSIIVIKNDDGLCLPRALVVGEAVANKTETFGQEWFKKVRHHNRSNDHQKTAALTLAAQAGIQNPSNGGGINDVEKYQAVLTNHRIRVYNDRGAADIIFDGNAPQARKEINLLYCNNHFNVITSMARFFCKNKYCNLCCKGYDHEYQHRCSFACVHCLQTPKCEETVTKCCDICGRTFVSDDCFKNHLLPHFDHKKSVCETLRRCRQCTTIYSLAARGKDGKHVCGESFCLNCNSHVPPGHLCYVQPLKAKPQKKRMFVFFDIESRQDDNYENTNARQHIPNFIAAETSCDACVMDEGLTNPICNVCGPRQFVWDKEDELMEKFFEFLLSERRGITDVVVIAHNMKGYDGMFVLNHMVQVQNWVPDVVFTGSKAMKISYGKLTFLDSLNYFMAALSKLPKMFEIDGCEKGYFPHFFNTKDNQCYVGELPLHHYYGSDNMKSSEREKFLSWYDQEKNKNISFDFRAEIRKYCLNDVKILRIACLRFRAFFLREYNIDIFGECVTIASTAMRVFRTIFLKKNIIGKIPQGSYRWADKQSKIAVEWLSFLEESENRTIQHAGNGREVKVLGSKVDGFDEENKLVYEFHGCWWHGCPKCFDTTKNISAPVRSMLVSRYEATVLRSQKYIEAGYTVIEMWECEYKRMKLENDAVSAFVARYSNITPLDERESYFGGRTDVDCRYYKTNEVLGEKVKYLDFVSLYPTVLKYGIFPLGHPKIYSGSQCPSDLSGIEGLVKLTVLPPQNLLHGILPAKYNGRLCFTLCHSCAVNVATTECQHTESERYLTGTWVILEVRKAVQLGYKVIQIHEVWEYRTVQYGPCDSGLFSEYINAFLKIKLEASGLPPSIKNDDDLDNFLRLCESKENIKLDRNKIKSNPGLRTISKLLLNSLYGKFAQRANLPKTEFIKSPAEFYSLLSDPTKEVANVEPIGDEIIYVTWRHIEEATPELPFTNVVIAAFVTAQARLKLYECLEKLQDRVLYYDTDSVIFTEKPGQVSLPTGSFLGEMTDELECYGEGSYISEFVSGGAKNYAYKVRTPSGKEEVVVKVRGITLDYSTERDINFDVIKQAVLGQLTDITTEQHRITRKNRFDVVSVVQTKLYRPVYGKRLLTDDYWTIPFGYKRTKVSDK